MDQFFLLLSGLPLLSALLMHLSAPILGRRVAQISLIAGGLTFVLAFGLLMVSVSGAEASVQTLGQNWGSLLFDPLSILMSAVIAGISFIVHVYSVRYMAEEAGYARFFILLDLMTAALLVMVAAGDLITLIVAWHLIGILLYFLLAHDTRSRPASRYAFWTFFTYRIGDLPLVLAAILLYQAFDTWSLSAIFAGFAQQPEITTLYGLSLAEVVGALIAFAAFARSAQFLLHTWLPYTMAGPTPVSALMHAGIVNAGGFLINRFAPVYMHSGDALHWVFIVGLVTSVIGSILMLTQNDIKKALGYSTMGQMGFMIMECGVGAFSLAIFHLIAHGLFKGTLFLSAGSVIHEARQRDSVPKDDIYTFIVERRPARSRQPWLLMAAITLTVPIIVFAVAHWLVAGDFFQKQGAVVLLFFGWVTGAQLLFSSYRMPTQNLWRLISMIVFSFIVVVLGYTLISHAFDLFLYPDAAMRNQIYAAAGIDFFWFVLFMSIVSCVIVLGWLLTYYTERRQQSHQRHGHLWMNFYAMVSREFYVIDFY
ncbi:MAG: proton-conducting transporter membrane subunit, partial [Gammaproteobacteria bacterium]